MVVLFGDSKIHTVVETCTLHWILEACDIFLLRDTRDTFFTEMNSITPRLPLSSVYLRNSGLSFLKEARNSLSWSSGYHKFQRKGVLQNSKDDNVSCDFGELGINGKENGLAQIIVGYSDESGVISSTTVSGQGYSVIDVTKEAEMEIIRIANDFDHSISSDDSEMSHNLVLKSKKKVKIREADKVEDLKDDVIMAIMPPKGLQEAIAEDVEGVSVDRLLFSDAVYNKELRFHFQTKKLLFISLKFYSFFFLLNSVGWLLTGESSTLLLTKGLHYLRFVPSEEHLLSISFFQRKK